MSKVFIDTNLWVYLYSTDKKSVIVEKLVANDFKNIFISTQTLNELFFVLTRKKLTTVESAARIIDDLSSRL